MSAMTAYDALAEQLGEEMAELRTELQRVSAQRDRLAAGHRRIIAGHLEGDVLSPVVVAQAALRDTGLSWPAAERGGV